MIFVAAQIIVLWFFLMSTVDFNISIETEVSIVDKYNAWVLDQLQTFYLLLLKN